MGDLLQAWSQITRLSFRGESHFSSMDNGSEEILIAPEHSHFECVLADLALAEARWELELKGNQRHWHWIPFPRPIRYRIEYTPQVHRWIDGSAPFHASRTTETSDGIIATKTIFQEKAGVGDPRRNRYMVDAAKSARRIDTRTLGLFYLPPLISVGHYQILHEINKPGVIPEYPTDTPWLKTYLLSFPDNILEVKAVWHSRYNWLTSIESTRRGIPTELLDRLRENPNPGPEERERLRTERVVVETSRYEASEFEESANGEIWFPRNMTYVEDFRKSHKSWSWKFDQWNTAPQLSDDLFRTKIPAGARINDGRKREAPPDSPS